jgi:AraC-like DNA-binding protein
MPINYFNIEAGVAGFSQQDYYTEPHAHFFIEMAFSLSGSLTIGTNNYKYPNIQAAIIGSNVQHTFSCLGAECQLYFIDPTADIGEQVSKDYLAGNEEIVVLDTISAEKLYDREGNFIALDGQHSYLHKQNRDERMQKCLDCIEANIASEGINISMLSERLFLSESRLAHLFKEQIGISIHQYILWKKIEVAVKRSQEGYSLTDCAHYAGFIDSSHLNKTFKRMFGVNPFFALKE